MTQSNNKWQCVGQRKDGSLPPINANHPPELVDGDSCPTCGLKRNEVVSNRGTGISLKKLALPLSALIAILVLGGLVRFVLTTNRQPSSNFLPDNAGRSFDHAHSSAILSVAITPDGQTLFTGGSDSIIRAWNLETRRPTATLGEHNGRVNSLAVFPESDFLVSGSGDGTVRVWDLSTDLSTSEPEKLNANQNNASSSRVLSVAVSQDDRYIAAGTDDGYIYVWDTNSLRQIAALQHENESHPVQDIAFDPMDNNRLAVARDGGTADLWDFRNGSPTLVGSIDDGKRRFFSVAMSPDGETLATGNFDGEIVLWDTSTFEKTRELLFNGHEFLVSSLIFGGDGDLLVSSGYDETIRIWDLSEGNPYRRTISAHSGFVNDIALSENSIISVGLDTQIRITPLEIENSPE